MAALSAASSFTHMSLEALLSHDHELYLDRILEEVVGANCMPDSCPLMQSRECDLALNVLQIVVSGQSQPQKEALFFCTRSSWSLLRALVQMLSFEGFIVFGVCHTRLEPNGFASVTLMHSPSHAINNVGCLCHTNGSIWFLLPFKHISPFQRLVARKFNFNVTEMMCNYFKVQDSALIPDSKL
ncbi:uncharacterized protein LOC127752180, partial [Frankliniella occidentalis]|uniref:Uncharacterized protein LOC127752180 n=1 Tax=Frankliniella occidentalis TaxID=133901 RepID=A0A9C6XBE7_FRAOC